MKLEKQLLPIIKDQYYITCDQLEIRKHDQYLNETTHIKFPNWNEEELCVYPRDQSALISNFVLSVVYSLLYTFTYMYLCVY